MEEIIKNLNIPEENKTLLLKAFALKDSQLATKNTELKELKTKYAALLEQFKLSKQRQFGCSTESDRQAKLFDEADVPLSKGAKEEIDDSITVTYKRQRKPKRKPLPKDLPREEVIHDIPAEEKLCHCGCEMKHIGDDITEQLDVIPTQIKVIRHIKRKYACRTCYEGIKTAPMPKLFLPKSIATSGLVAYTITSKYVDHIPLYRQEAIWKRYGIELPRNTTCAWIMKAAELCLPLYQVLKKCLITSDYVQADETTVQVLKELNKKNISKSYMWVYRGGPPDTPVIVFDYQQSRSQVHPKHFLDEFQGALQTDAYAGYNAIVEKNQLRHLGCMAHARRPFIELVKLTDTPGLAHEAINYFKKLYVIETKARENKLSHEEREVLRHKEAKPILEEFYQWLLKVFPQTPKSLKIGEAIGYLLTHWHKLTAYLNDGRYEIDNNLIENCIRPFTLGRKNWIFKGSPRGAKAGAVLYSLIATCKANDIEPYHYFRCCFEKIRACKSQEDYIKLLPQNISLICQ